MGDPKRRHLRSLTSLRFVAAILVVVFHLSLYMGSLPTVAKLVAGGYVGVTFFFVLSGFVLTYSRDTNDPRTSRFLRRRFARIYPVHLLFAAVATLPFNPAPNWPALPANLLLLQSWSPSDAVARSFSSVSWSLSCEFFFYAAFPLLVRWIERVRRPLAAVALLMSVAFSLGVAVQLRSGEWALWLFHLPPFRAVEFVCGALAARAMQRGWSPKVRLRWAAGSVVLSYLLVLFLPVAIGYRDEDRWALTLAMVPSFTLLIATCAHLDLVGVRTPLQARAMVCLGQWSFCMYMVHPLVIRLTLPLLGSASVARTVLACLAVIGTVVLVSYMLYATYERPLERRLRGTSHGRLSDEAMPSPGDNRVTASAPEALPN